jgi:hypothetical protein
MARTACQNWLGLGFVRIVFYFFRKNLAASVSIKKGQFSATLRRFFRPMFHIELKNRLD